MVGCSGIVWAGESLLPLDQARRLGMLDHPSNNRPLSLLGAWSAPGDSQGKGPLRGFPSKPIVSIEYMIQLGNLFLKEVPESRASIVCLLFQDIHHPGCVLNTSLCSIDTRPVK